MNVRRVATAAGVAWCAAVGIGSSCDFTQKAQSNTLAAATLLATPSYDLVVTFDGGTFDAGSVPSVVTSALFFGNRDPNNPAADPSGLSGAGVTVGFTGSTLNLGDQGGGKYSLDSTQNSQLVYTAGAVYTFQVAYSGQTYVGAVTAPPQERIAQFHPTPYAPITVQVNTPFTLQRQAPPSGQSYLPAFTVVFPLDASGNRQAPTYDNVPAKPLDLLNFVVDDSAWTTPIISLPGSAFPSAGTRYLVVVTAVQKGDQSQFSSNLFLGSAFVAGTADVGLAQTP